MCVPRNATPLLHLLTQTQTQTCKKATLQQLILRVRLFICSFVYLFVCLFVRLSVGSSKVNAADFVSAKKTEQNFVEPFESDFLFVDLREIRSRLIAFYARGLKTFFTVLKTATSL